MKEIVNAYPSNPGALLARGPRGFGLLSERLQLVVLGLQPDGAQDRLAKPLQPEDQQQAAHQHPQQVDRQ